MDWLEITIEIKPAQLELLASQLEDLGVEGLVINDEQSIREHLDNNPTSWDFVDDEVFDALRGHSSVQFYLEDSENGEAQLAQYRAALPDYSLSSRHVCDEDWMNNWKAFFKPTEIGRRLLIVPEWEPIPEHTDRVILRIEPKNAFGTGAHASTKMCLEELENHSTVHVLDLGCGSGILAVAALLFGAQSAVACDISADAEHVCRDNAKLNNLADSKLRAYTGNILDRTVLADITAGTHYDVVFANIIADVIIPLAPFVKDLLTPTGVLICSGIIDGRENDVISALEGSGLHIVNARHTDNWHMLCAALEKR